MMADDDRDELAAQIDDEIAAEMIGEFFGERDELAAHLVDDGTLAEWTECEECSVVYPKHELVKCPGCGLLLCENCDPHGAACENYAL